MEYIQITEENIGREHICCAISNEKDVQVASKKGWLRERFPEGLIFRRADARGKCFIEYLPAEVAWAPVEADGWMYIDCLWVSGQFKGCGYASELLDGCISDSREKGKKGLVILSSPKKRGFLSDPAYMRSKGFVPVDTAPPYFELLCLPFADAPLPRFKACVKAPRGVQQGLTIYYTAQCPFTAKYVPLLVETAARRGVTINAVQLKSRAEAQNAPSPYTAFSLFYNGEFITHEILSEKKLEAFLDEKGL